MSQPPLPPPRITLPARRGATTVLRHRDWSDHRGRDTSLAVTTVSSDRDNATVRVGGELDAGNAAPLWAVLRHHLGAGRHFLRLDVSTLTFVDATALTGLTDIHREALAARGTLVLTGVRPRVARILHMTGLDEVLFLGGSRAEHDVDVPSPS